MKLLPFFYWHDGKQIPVGYGVTYETKEKCPTCGHDMGGVETGIIKEIRDHEDRGFAEVGSHLELVLEDGTVIQGDSENGFGIYAAYPPSPEN